jgi:hypothetical protein
LRAVRLSNDKANHRVAIAAIPGLADDPDRNSVELMADKSGDWEKSTKYIRTSPEFAARPIGT